jgi:glycerol-3-phosphate dehydrogenase (NAD(P)+)
VGARRAQAQAMAGQRENARYLPGMALAARAARARRRPAGPLQAVPRADLVIVATPVAGLRGCCGGCTACTRAGGLAVQGL